jgi:hypothetical protein
MLQRKQQQSQYSEDTQNFALASGEPEDPSFVGSKLAVRRGKDT